MSRTLTRKGVATRQRIIEGAAAEIRGRGVAATTLDDIRARTRTSKGQLFHYFPGGKDELLLAVARHEADQVLADQQPELGDLTSWPAWSAWRDRVIDRYRGQGSDCPLGYLVSHLGSSTPGARAVVIEMLRAWRAQLATGIRYMQGVGEVDPDLDAERAAAALLTGVQGGVAVFMATEDITYLEAALDAGIENLRAHRRPAPSYPA
jgi:AcrR family transcriptional regulator